MEKVQLSGNTVAVPTKEPCFNCLHLPFEGLLEAGFWNDLGELSTAGKYNTGLDTPTFWVTLLHPVLAYITPTCYTCAIMLPRRNPLRTQLCVSLCLPHGSVCTWHTEVNIKIPGLSWIPLRQQRIPTYPHQLISSSMQVAE